MANSMSDLTPKILLSGRQVLRKTTSFLSLTNGQFEAVKGIIGKTIDIPVAPALTAENDTAAATPPDGTDISASTKQITLSYTRRSVPVRVTNQELQNYQLGSFLDRMIQEAIAAVVGDVNSKLVALYKDIPYLCGTAGTSLFATTINSLNLADKVLRDNKNNPQVQNFNAVVTTKEISNLKSTSDVKYSNYFGSDEVTRGGGNLGYIPNVLGFDVHTDQDIVKHTTGTITTGLVVKSGTTPAVDESTLVCTTAASTGAVALKDGDIVSIDGNTYALTADATESSPSTDVTLAFQPALVSAPSAGDAVTLATGHGTSYMNIAGDFTGIGLATRLSEDIPSGNPDWGSDRDVHLPIIDPVTGLAVTLSFIKQYRQRTMTASLVYGCAVTHAEKLVRMYGLATN